MHFWDKYLIKNYSGQSYVTNVGVLIHFTANLISGTQTPAVRLLQPEHLQFPGSAGGRSG